MSADCEYELLNDDGTLWIIAWGTVPIGDNSLGFLDGSNVRYFPGMCCVI